MIDTLEQRVSIGSFDLSGTHADGVDVVTTTFDGWGAPTVRMGVSPKPYGHGSWVGSGFHAERYITLAGSIVAPTADLANAAFDDLVASVPLSPAATTLTVVERSLTRHVSVSRKGEVGHDVTANGLVINWSMVLVAPDARKTAASLIQTTSLPSSTGGVSFPLSFPLTFSESVTSGRIALTNPGNAPGRVALRVTAGTGGLTAPSVTHIASGVTLQFASAMTIPEGNWIDVDMEAQTVLENGQPGASRNSWVTGRGWSSFDPGANEWAFNAASGVGTLEVTATPAWW